MSASEGAGDGASERALGVLRERGVIGPVDIAFVLGTGLGSMADAVEAPIAVPYADLPGFPAGEVSGHARRLVVGTWEGARVAVLQGRAHYYEAGDAAAMAVPLETLARLGATTLVLSNTAGSTHADWRPGGLAILSDHINFAGTNPLIGIEGEDRFVTMTDAYDPALRAALRAAADRADLPAPHDAVYMWFSGPSFETPAEVRVAGLLGADLVGMSTVPEVILARRLGLRVAAVSVITNLGAGLRGASPSHDETKAVAGGRAAADLTRLLRCFVRDRASRP